jgi:RNA 2',3'-cyclic 3'-phosphodiesterase
MRLFIAILFDDSVIDQLSCGMASLKQQSIQGNFTRPENFHLTLAFLGETNQVEKAKRAINTVSFPSFSLLMNRLGYFERTGGNIYWVGMARNPLLSDLHHRLSSALSGEGFLLEDRAYRPHLTLGRQVLLTPQFDPQKWESEYLPIHTPVTKVSLMKSERIQEKLTYTELFYQTSRE